MSIIRQKAIAGLQTGDKFSVSRTFSEQDVMQFAELSRDYNPIHFDKRFCKVKNFDGVICHGLLVASLVTEVGGQIGWLASGMSFTFKKPVYIGDTIKCDLTLTEIDAGNRAKAEAVLTNQHHITVLQAVLFGIIPGRQEKQVLRDMMSEGDPTNKVSYKTHCDQ